MICDSGFGGVCASTLWLVHKLAFRSAIWNCVVHVVSWKQLAPWHWFFFRLISVYLCHNVVFTLKFPLLGLTVIVVEISVFFKLTMCTRCTISIGWLCRRDSMMYKLSLA